MLISHYFPVKSLFPAIHVSTQSSILFKVVRGIRSEADVIILTLYMSVSVTTLPADQTDIWT